MIAYLEGKIILKKDKFIIVEVAGIGYKVFLNRQTLLKLPAFAEASAGKPEIGQSVNPVRNSPPTGPLGAQSAGEISNGVKLFTFQRVKEDALDLYGFLTYGEYEFFEVLMDIRGVGPKSALDISALGSLDKIKDKILAQDEKIFEGIPGIGAKKAMTIILELTGKINTQIKTKSSADEAENALVQLGFSKQQARDALSNVPSSKSSEDRVKLALKNIRK